MARTRVYERKSFAENPESFVVNPKDSVAKFCALPNLPLVMRKEAFQASDMFGFGYFLSECGYVGLPTANPKLFLTVDEAENAAQLWWKMKSVEKKGDMFVLAIQSISDEAFSDRSEALDFLAGVLDRENARGIVAHGGNQPSIVAKKRPYREVSPPPSDDEREAPLYVRPFPMPEFAVPLDLDDEDVDIAAQSPKSYDAPPSSAEEFQSNVAAFVRKHVELEELVVSLKKRVAELETTIIEGASAQKQATPPKACFKCKKVAGPGSSTVCGAFCAKKHLICEDCALAMTMKQKNDKTADGLFCSACNVDADAPTDFLPLSAEDVVGATNLDLNLNADVDEVCYMVYLTLAAKRSKLARTLRMHANVEGCEEIAALKAKLADPALTNDDYSACIYSFCAL